MTKTIRLFCSDLNFTRYSATAAPPPGRRSGRSLIPRTTSCNAARFVGGRCVKEAMSNIATNWIWPAQARAAISLSYDDGNPDNLDYAIPDLNDRGLRGTFYLTTGSKHMQARKQDWRKAFSQGHEVGNHSVHHPCRADIYAPNIPKWLKPSMYLENYSPQDITREVDEAAGWLNKEIGEDLRRTYAYPCGSVAIGKVPDEASYDAAIRRHHFAARIGGQLTNDPQTVSLRRIHSFGFSGPTLSDLIGYCEAALNTGGWTVLMFHSVGGPNHNTERQVHQALLGYLLKEPYWVLPVRDVASFIAEKRTRHTGR